jgi:hypothetical protein
MKVNAALLCPHSKFPTLQPIFLPTNLLKAMKIHQIITQIVIIAVLSIIFINAVYAQNQNIQPNTSGISKLERNSEIQNNPSKEMIIERTKEIEQQINLTVSSLRTKLNNQNKRERFDRDFAGTLYTESNNMLPAIKIKEVLHYKQSIILEPGTDLKAANIVLEMLKNIENQLN